MKFLKWETSRGDNRLNLELMKENDRLTKRVEELESGLLDESESAHSTSSCSECKRYREELYSEYSERVSEYHAKREKLSMALSGAVKGAEHWKTIADIALEQNEIVRVTLVETAECIMPNAIVNHTTIKREEYYRKKQKRWVALEKKLSELLAGEPDELRRFRIEKTREESATC